ncbi:hypothetical protein AR9_g246 [Bacillus phage AR9]|uniref:Uncharacterized protein n=1 Tax=Bacillus phage AR9 TaxID=1815509 RepID=A0A172JIE9_BPPB1|nr:hypothetical protein BI022_gp245 [Bacillus phage AR9]AMS01330.1 hypothetical protein AR9_g246 [Bacillus phage AR9]
MTMLTVKQRIGNLHDNINNARSNIVSLSDNINEIKEIYKEINSSKSFLRDVEQLLATKYNNEIKKILESIFDNKTLTGFHENTETNVVNVSLNLFDKITKDVDEEFFDINILEILSSQRIEIDFDSRIIENVSMKSTLEFISSIIRQKIESKEVLNIRLNHNLKRLDKSIKITKKSREINQESKNKINEQIIANEIYITKANNFIKEPQLNIYIQKLEKEIESSMEKMKNYLDSYFGIEFFIQSKNNRLSESLSSN